MMTPMYRIGSKLPSMDSIAFKDSSQWVSDELLYRCEAIHLKERALKKLETAQGNFIKSFLGLSKSS